MSKHCLIQPRKPAPKGKSLQQAGSRTIATEVNETTDETGTDTVMEAETAIETASARNTVEIADVTNQTAPKPRQLQPASMAAFLRAARVGTGAGVAMTNDVVHVVTGTVPRIEDEETVTFIEAMDAHARVLGARIATIVRATIDEIEIVTTTAKTIVADATRAAEKDVGPAGAPSDVCAAAGSSSQN